MEEQRRRGKLSDEELELLAESIVVKLTDKHNCKPCKITADQQQAVIDLIVQKKKVVKGVLWLAALLVVWALKDIYTIITTYISSHITWGR